MVERDDFTDIDRLRYDRSKILIWRALDMAMLWLKKFLDRAME